MGIKETVFNTNGIHERMADIHKPKKSDMYLYAKGLGGVLTRRQISNIEKIVDTDYKRMKLFLKQSKLTAKN